MTVGVTEASQAHHMWINIWFDLGLAFVVIGLAATAIGTYLHFRSKTSGTVPADEAGTVDPTGLPPLVVKIKGNPQWENWKYIAWIAAFHVQITNTTDQRILIASFGFTTDNRGLQPWESTATNEQHGSVEGEIGAKQERSYYGAPLRTQNQVPARDSVSGWFVTAVTRDPAGGTPRCMIIVKDDIGNQYTATVPAQEPKVYRG